MLPSRKKYLLCFHRAMKAFWFIWWHQVVGVKNIYQIICLSDIDDDVTLSPSVFLSNKCLVRRETSTLLFRVFLSFHKRMERDSIFNSLNQFFVFESLEVKKRSWLLKDLFGTSTCWKFCIGTSRWTTTWFLTVTSISFGFVYFLDGQKPICLLRKNFCVSLFQNVCSTC